MRLSQQVVCPNNMATGGTSECSVRVKICGITNNDDAICAYEAGADMLGFIFAQKSPRYITYDNVRQIVNELNAWLSHHGQTKTTLKPKLCGVFVNEEPSCVLELLRSGTIDYAQMHGEETLQQVESYQGRAYKVLRPNNAGYAEILPTAKTYASAGVSAGPSILLDAYSPAAYGGTGLRTDWQLAAALAKSIDGLMLAGGLTPDNVAEAVSTVRPWAVDASSGVEESPGRKDHEAVRRFVQAAKRAMPH